jgi:hypothetical protein
VEEFQGRRSDPFSRYAPVIDPRFSDRGEDVVATLEKACAALCTPHPVRWLGDLETAFADRKKGKSVSYVDAETPLCITAL